MEILRKWKAKRAGAGITITHSTGRIAGIELVQVELRDGAIAVVVATGKDGVRYELAS